ncbi:hypothetical protein pipiens_004807 [Culex pipiens pipiens]|uniref:TEP1-F n=1 Tax=Culex pipiens pipiens TaxID=38569 RepID=A0ABD1CEM8_CULPP
MEREYDQQVQQHDGQYRDGRNDGSRYSSDRMANNNNKNKLLNQRSSKEKDRRGSDCKVTTSLQFKNQTRNKTNEGGLPMAGPGGVAGGQVVHSNSAGALSGSVQSNKMNNAIVLPVGGVPERMLDQRPVKQHRCPDPAGSTAAAADPTAAAPSTAIALQRSLRFVRGFEDAMFPYNPPANATIQSVEIGKRTFLSTRRRSRRRNAPAKIVSSRCRQACRRPAPPDRCDVAAFIYYSSRSFNATDKMNRYLAVFCAFLSVVAPGIANAGNYLIYAPNYIRINERYQLAISTFNVSDHFELNVAIVGFNEKDEEIKVDRLVRMRMRDETRIVELDHSSIQSESYTLKLESKTAPEINREIPLTLVTKTHAVLIQTDQPIYKPGNTVKFRIFVLDQTTKPIADLDTISVELKNPDDFVIKKWPSAKLRNGIFQSQLEIANQPNLGNWSITAIVRGEEHTRKFMVDEYKLPQHEIRISSPGVSTLDDEMMTVDVEAWYTFGKPIKGEITVTAGNVQKVVTKFNGRLRSTFRIQDVVSSVDSDSTVTEVDVSLRELHTKKIFTASDTIQIFRKPHKVILKQSSKQFVPGHPYRCWLQFTDPFGGPPKNLPQQVTLNVSYEGNGKLPKINELHLTPNGDGIVPLVLSIPEKATHAELVVRGEGIDEQFFLHSGPLQAPGFFQASLLTDKPAIGYPVSVQVQSSNALDFVVYQVVAPEANSSGEEDRRQCVRDGKIMSDSVDVEVDQLKNSLKMVASDHHAPGETFRMHVETMPNSTVGILAIDKSALLLESGNQITKKAIFDELLGRSDEEEEFGGEDLEAEDLTVITNLVQLIALRPRFGNYDGVEEDEYIKPRKVFPQSWLWNKLINSGPEGHLTIAETIPDTITNWQISAFSLNPVHGLGVLETPLALHVTKPFFVMLNLPYSIKKSETATVEVSVFNYLDELMYVGVTLKNHRQEFEFVGNSEGRTDASYQIKNLVLTPQSAKSVKFLVKAKKMGDIMIKVVAESETASDSVERFLRVMPESLPYNKKESRYIELKDSGEESRMSIDLEMPKYLDAGSENISFTVYSDLLGSAADDLQNLIRMPSGSGEQNVLKMVPNVVLVDYIAATKAFDSRVKARAVRFLELGYQNQLKFRREDGSFNVMGKEDPLGSVFITALVVKTLKQASRFITVDDSVIEQAYDWLKNKQNLDGSFNEGGDLTNRELQKSHSDEDTLTAFVMIAFLEDGSTTNKYQSVIKKGTDFLAAKDLHMQSTYTLSLIAYTLQLANHPSKRSAFDELLLNSKSSTSPKARWWDAGSNSLEATSYFLLTTLLLGNYVDSLPIVYWLTKNQYYYSGTLENTQTTFVSLQALAEYAKRVSTLRNNYYVTLTCYDRRKLKLPQNYAIQINPQNSKAPLTLTLPSETRSLDLTLSGTGNGMFTINYHYHSNILRLNPRFTVKVKTLNTTTDEYMDLRVCAKFKPREAYERAALTLMEITFPSGYIAFDETVQELEQSDVVKKVATKHDETTLVLYFDTIPEHRFQCVDVTGFQQSVVLQQAPGTVRVYDFYDTTLVAIEYFDRK